MLVRASVSSWFLLPAILIACGGRVSIEQSAGVAEQGGIAGLGGAPGVVGVGGVISTSLAGASGAGGAAGALAQGGRASGGASGTSAGGASGNGHLGGSSGAASCDAATGVQCGTDACTPGTPCNPDGDLCRAGVTSCSTGQAMCLFMGNAADGTSCGTVGGTAEVCMNGVCGSCGAPCTPTDNPCQTGILSCSTAQPTCVATGTAKDATLCGASGICCGGTCTACVTTTNVVEVCTTNNTCAVSCNDELTLCGDRCVDTTNDSSACGAGCNVCAAGSMCFNSQCSVEYGHATAFSPCSYLNGMIPAGVLVGEPVVLPASTVTGLGVIAVIGTEYPSVVMALYSNVNGVPSSPLVQTASTSITAGPNVLLTNQPKTLLAGTYWVMAEFSAQAYVCADGATNNFVDYGSESYGTLPSNFVPTNTVSGSNYNFYVVAH
jgi:hypothetical protein